MTDALKNAAEQFVAHAADERKKGDTKGLDAGMLDYFAEIFSEALAKPQPEAVDLTAQRKKFMNWACDEFKTVHVKGDGFKEHDVRAAWLGWKAALAGGGV